jgi:hypothetical protein
MKLQGKAENIKITKAYLKFLSTNTKPNSTTAQDIEQAVNANPTASLWKFDGTVPAVGILNCDQFVKKPALKIFKHELEGGHQ